MNLRAIILTLTAMYAFSTSAQTTSDSITVTNAKWHVKKHRGVKTMHAQFSNLYGGPQDIYMIEVRLRRHSLKVQDHHGRELTSLFSQKNGAKAAVNGTYFEMKPEGRSVCLMACDGRAMDFTGGSMDQLSNGALVTRGRHARIIPWDVEQERILYPDSVATGDLAHCDVMVCGPLMLQNGREVPLHSQSHVMENHPRSGIALKGNHAYFIVVDGRAPSRAVGVSIPQFAHLVRILKMDSALNLDGGGSSTLWVPQEGILNTPSSQGQERSVSNSIMVK